MSHARLSPSASARWAYCTASVAAIEAAGLPDEGPNDAADEGTAAHQVRAECLTLGMPARAFVGTKVAVNGKDWEVTEEMADYLQPGIDWIEERAGAELIVEQRVNLEPWLPGQFGTLDAGFVYEDCDENVVLAISDLKYGVRIAVDPKENSQQMIYALGLRELARKRLADIIEIVIDQPRKGGLKTWRTTPKRLLEFGDWIAERGAEALSGNGVFRPGDKTCAYCPLLDTCEARTQWLGDMLDEAVDLESETPTLRVTSLEVRGKIVRHASLIKGLIDQLVREARDDLLAGEAVPGVKLVLGQRGDREWSDPAVAAAELTAALGDAAYVQPAPKLLSPPQAEKVLKKKHPTWAKLQQHITRAPAAPILVPEEDSRLAYQSVDTEFSEME